MESSENLSSLDKPQQPSQYAYSDYRLSEFLMQDSDSLLSILQNPNCSISGGVEEEQPPSQRMEHGTLIKCGLDSPSRKITKRKSSTSKRTLTRFIATDAANFRQMVQLVTGVRCCHQKEQQQQHQQQQQEQYVDSLIRHESQDRHLPTLDTSDGFLLFDHDQFLYSSLPTIAGDGVVAAKFFDPDCMATGFPVFDSWKEI